ncbi:MAG: alpha-L-fucosidase [Bacteroidota bacterium]
MRKLFLVILLFALSAPIAWSQNGDEDANMFNLAKQRDQKMIDEAKNGWWTASMKNKDKRLQWWRDAKFGMFIHWGVYSLPAGEWKGKKVSGYAEHLMRKEKISRKEYLDIAHQFNPVLFNAEQWILDAKKAGMNYFIVTAKHHDGFAMYDSKVSDFDIVDQTPFKRDPMAELAKAAKKHGMKFGFYYSHAFDWEHPDAPGNDWEFKNPGGDSLLGGANWFDNHPEWLPKAVKYVDEKAIPQIKELLNTYHPDIIWFDTPHKLPLSENIRILKAIRETAPNVVVNGRLARNGAGNFGDYLNTGDRPAEFRKVSESDWEAIPTTNESYGYSKTDNSHKSPKFFIQLLAKSAALDGNLLLNIGPKGDGAFDSKDLTILKGIEKWVSKNEEGIYKTHKTDMPIQDWGVTTQKDNKLYLHVFNWPKDGKLYVGGLKSKIDKAYFLTEPTKTLTTQVLSNIDVSVNVPKLAPDTANTIIVIALKEKLNTDMVRFVSPNMDLVRLLAFDANLTKGFKFGDGKTDRYYIDNWTTKDQVVSWDFRTVAAQKFKVVVKYLAGNDSGGNYTFKIDQKEFKQDVMPGGTKVVAQVLGEIQIDKGIHKLTISPNAILKSELMKLLEVQLIPVN